VASIGFGGSGSVLTQSTYDSEIQKAQALYQMYWNQGQQTLAYRELAVLQTLQNMQRASATSAEHTPLSPPGSPTPRPVIQGKLTDLRVTRSDYGSAIPQVWGIGRVGGNVIWTTDLIQHVRKGAGNSTTTAVSSVVPGTAVYNPSSQDTTPAAETYYYTVSLAVAVCRGPVLDIRRIWANDLLVYDCTRPQRTRHNITIYLGTEEQEVDPTLETALGAGNVPAYRGLCYVVFKNLDITKFDNQIPQFSFEVIQETELTTGAVLADVFTQVGLAADDYDVSAAADTMVGMMLEQRQPARDALEHLLRCYATDLAEIDGKLVAIRQGCGGTAIPADDLGAREWSGASEPPDRLQIHRKSDLELPARVDLSYFDPGRKYEVSVQSALRPSKLYTDQLVSYNTPLVLGSTAARRITDRLLQKEWAERTSFSLSLPPRYLWIAPGTPLTLPLDDAGNTARVRITGMDFGLPGELRCSAVIDDDYLLTQTAVGAEALTPPSVFDSGSDSLFAAWSGPAWQDGDLAAPGFYVAAGPAPGSGPWLGAAVYYSTDSEATWSAALRLTSPAVFGVAQSVLADGSLSTWDDTNTVDVVVHPPQTVYSGTRLLVESGGNWAYLGDELIGVVDVESLGSNSYRLANMHRGLRGSAVSGHVIGERFVQITAAVRRVVMPYTLVGQSIAVRVVTDDQSIADVTSQWVTILNPANPYPRLGPGLKFNLATNSQYSPLMFR
jgi:hypothetical protein